MVAQVGYNLDFNKSSIVISGTSTLHNWEMNVTNASGGFILSDDLTDLGKLTEGSIRIDVSGIRSESNLMDKKAHDALKLKQFPQIKIKIENAAGKTGSGNATLLFAIAGTTKTVTDNFQILEEHQGNVAISGTLDIKMSEFGIAPPVAMLGTLKTGDSVSLRYNLHFRKDNKLTYAGNPLKEGTDKP